MLFQDEKDFIVSYHNDLRRKVANGEETRGLDGAQSSATNMNALVWDDELATVAQR